LLRVTSVPSGPAAREDCVADLHDSVVDENVDGGAEKFLF
jgi:hypothetical protein